ncbi:hypothetical protein KSW81_002539 [Nannochloris sp. 'desiccata']|nr:hypothetical protein KSW81_002539 [Chlorella desiccata (nom. nud.)]
MESIREGKEGVSTISVMPGTGAGAEAAVTRAVVTRALLPADPLHIYTDDGHSTILHYICTGQPVGALNTSDEKNAALLLSVPDSLGRTALCIAIASQQWEAVQLLLDTAALSHPGIQASYRIHQALGAENDGDGFGSRKIRRRKTTGGSTISSLSFVAAGSGAGAVITGAVGGVLNKIWDSWGGNAAEVDSIEKHRTELREGSGSGSGGGGRGNTSNKTLITKSKEDPLCSSPSASSSPFTSSTTTITTSTVGTSQSSTPLAVKLPCVSVLGDLSAVQRRQRHQIDRVAGLLNISISEAMEVLMKYNWDEAVALTVSIPSLQGEEKENGEDDEVRGAARKVPKPSFILGKTANTTQEERSDAKQDRTNDGFHSAEEEDEDENKQGTENKEKERPQLKSRRTCMLVAEKYVQTAHDLRWCPAAGCTMCLQLPGGESGKVAEMAAASGKGIDAYCSYCTHSSCWSCGEGSHEPASCTQASEWSAELANLRAMAPVSDQRWLAQHAKRCPGCNAFIQRTGGCNHMTCGCGKHWCWECGRDWSEHNADTGGFYFCSLVENEEGNAFDEEESEQESGGRQQGSNNNSSNNNSTSSSSGWLRDIWRSVHNVAGEATLHRCLQMQLRHECDEAAVRAVAAYLQDICSKMRSSGTFSENHSSGVGTNDNDKKKIAGAGPPPSVGGSSSSSSSVIASGGSTILLGPEQVGVSKREAAEMRAPEWATVVATACCSAAEDGIFHPKNVLKSILEISTTSAIKTNRNGTIISTNPALNINFPAIASVIIEAHMTLKNSAAPLRALPGGARRRYLVELCEETERYLALVEPVLMDAPYQTEAIEVGRGLLSPTSSGAGAQPPQPPHLQQQQRGFRGALSSFIQNIKGVPGLNYECRIPGVDAHVIVEQAHYVAAVQRQATELNIGEHVAALQKGINGLKDAGRKGLFA